MAVPSVAGMKQVRIRIVVVFPAPLGLKGEHLAFGDRECDTIDGRVLAVTLSDMVNVDHANESGARWWMGSV